MVHRSPVTLTMLRRASAGWLPPAVCLLLLSLLLYGLLPPLVPVGLFSYLLQPALWLAGGAWMAWLGLRAGPAPPPADRQLLTATAVAATVQVALVVVGGAVDGFRPSPYAGSTLSFLLDGWSAAAQMLGLELVRCRLIETLRPRGALLALALGASLPWLAQGSLWSFGRPAGGTGPMALVAQCLLSPATESLFAAYLAWVGGAPAALAYRGALAAFVWLSPMLPDLRWATARLLALGGPLVGWLIVSDAVEQMRVKRRLEQGLEAHAAEIESANVLLQALSRRLVEAQEAERRRIARELHDGVSQALISLKLGLSNLQRHAGDAEASRRAAAQLGEITDRVANSLHRLASELRPASLDHVGLPPALREYAASLAAQHGLELQFETVGVEGVRLAPEAEAAVFRIVQEALANVVRHAQAKRVGVILECRDGRLIAIVEDDGVGFDPQQAAHSERLGLMGMRERAEMLGGSLAVETAPGTGTAIRVEVAYEGTHPGSR